MGECEHKWVHLETIKSSLTRVCEATCRREKIWQKTDRFYCEKCLETTEKRRSECSQIQPDWF